MKIYDEIANKIFWQFYAGSWIFLSILDRKLWIEQLYIQKIWKTFS